MSGTLLGAHRHQGFIPWDNDIDVAMTELDFKVLKEKGTQTLAEHGIFLQSEESDPAWGSVHIKPIIGKLRDENSCYVDGSRWHDGFQVDIFGCYATEDEKIKVDDLVHAHSVIYPLGTAKFEGEMVKVPRRVKEFLNVDLGPDLEIPPPNKRLPHEPLGCYWRGCNA